ncbi:MAG TPA: NfeD family protein [Trichocoleus sp.]|jgi:membrane-bound ClpP family serine protease
MNFDRKSLFNFDGFPFISPEKSLKLPDEAVVDAMIQPGKSGRVKYRGSWWLARCQQDITLAPEQTVAVIGRSNITLLVQPLPQQA